MRLVLLLVVITLGLLPQANATAQDAAPGADTLVIGQTYAAYHDLGPARASAAIDMRLLRAMYETLVVHGDDGQTIQPGAAEAWDISDDGLIYTFHLRADAQWSNGSVVTAQDFAAGWLRSLIPDTGGDYASLHLVIDGAAEFIQWRNEYIDATIDAGGAQNHQRTREAWEEAKTWYLESVGVEAVDARTFRVILARPCPHFLHLITMPNFAPFPADRLDLNISTYMAGTTRIREENFADADWVLTNGPYRLASTEETRVELVVNEHHRAAEDVGFTTIIQRAYPDEDGVLAAYEWGEVHWIPIISDEQLCSRLLDAARDDVHLVQREGTYYYQFNCRPEVDGRPNPFADPALRRALAHTFDRDRLAALAGPAATPLGTLVPPDTMPGYTPPQEAVAPFDMEEAHRLLHNAGYGGDDPLGPVTMLANTTGVGPTANRLIAVWLSGCWSGVGVGMEPDVVLTRFHDYLARSHDGAFHVRRAGWFADYADPVAFLELLGPEGGYQTAGYSSEAFDQLMVNARAEQDPARRSSILREAEALLLQDAVIVPLYRYGTVTLYDPQRVDLPINPWMKPRLENISPAGE